MSTTAGFLRLVIDSTDVEKSDRALDNFAKTSQRVEGSVKIDMGQIEKALANLGQKVVKLDSTMSGALKNTAQNTRDQAKTFDQLRASIDPAFAAAQRYQQVQQELASRVEKGEVAQRTANIVLEQAASRYLGVTTASERAAEAQRVAEQAVVQSKVGYEALRASIDPIYATSKRYEAALETLNQAQKVGIITDKERARTMQLLEDQMQGIAGTSGVAGRGVSKFGHIANQVGFQVQDVFVSGPMIGWFRAISQQAPQAAGAFAMLGGRVGFLVPLIGTAVAVGGALIPTLLGIGREAENLDEKISKLETTMRDFRAGAVAGIEAVEYLTDEFGEFSIRAIDLNERMQQLRVREVLLDAADAAKTLSDSFRGFGRSELVRILDLLGQGVFDDTAVEAKRFAAALNEIRTASGVTGQLKATRALRDQFEKIIDVNGKLTDKQAEFYGTLLQTEKALSQAAGFVREADGATLSWASAMVSVGDEIDVIKASLASIGGGLISNAAKRVEIDALKAGASLRDAARAGREFQTEAGFNQRLENTSSFAEKAAIQVERFVARKGSALEKDLDREREIARERDRLSKSAGKAAASQVKAIQNLEREITQRNKLLGLTGKERRSFEALIDVRGRLGKEADKLSKRELENYAGQLVALEDQEDAMKRLENLAQERAGQITDILLEPGSAGDKVKELVKNIAAQALQQQIVLPIVGQFLGTQGVPSGILGGGGGAGGAAGALGGGGGFNPLGLAGNLLGGGGILGAFGGGVGLGVQGILGGNFGATLVGQLGSAATGSLTGLAGAFGAALPVIGAVAAAFSFFRTKTKLLDKGIRFTVDEMDVLIESFQRIEKSRFFGLKKSRRSRYSVLSNSESAPFEAAISDIQQGVISAADALGIGSRAFRAFEHQFTVSTKGLTDEEAQEAIQKALAGFSDEFAKVALGAARVVREGETATQALERLSSSLLAVNDAADLLGSREFATSLEGGDQASVLVDAFGGSNAFTSAVGTYYAAFYSQAEQVETSMRRLTERFSELGFALPRSRSAFRELVEGIDTTTETGAELYAQLLQLAGALDQVLPAVSAFSNQIQGVVSSVNSEIADQIAAVQGLSTDARDAAQLWYRTATTLRGFVDGLLNTNLSAVSASQTNEVNKNRFQTAFDLARGGDVDAARGIPELARNYLQSARTQSRTLLEFQRISAGVQNQVNFLAGIAELEGANEDVLESLYKRQIEVLTRLGDFLSLEGLTEEQVAQLSGGIQALHADWSGTVSAFEASLGSLEEAIINAEAFSYDDLVGRLDVAVSMSADAAPWMQELISAADDGLRTALDFVIRDNQLTPDLRWIAVNKASEHIASVEFVVSQGLKADAMALLTTERASIFRSIGLRFGSKSHGAVRDLLRLEELLSGDGKIDFAGGVKFEPAEAFSVLFDGVSLGVRDLIRPLDALKTPLDRLRDAISADLTYRQNASKITDLQNQGIALRDVQVERGSNIIRDIKALEDRTNIRLLRNGGRDAILRQRETGGITYKADFTSGGKGINEFNAEFRGADGLQEKIFSHNRTAKDEYQRLRGLRAQIEALGAIPAFANGTSFAPGGLSLVGELGPELVNLPRGAQVQTASKTKSMMDFSGVVSEVRALREELRQLRQETRQADLRKIQNSDEQLELAQRAAFSVETSNA